MPSPQMHDEDNTGTTKKSAGRDQTASQEAIKSASRNIKPKRNFESDKMRVKLTPIEEYEKTLVFHLTDAPARVVTRLERLMGSDSVNLMDHDWMRELEERLEEEDKKEWDKRNKIRIKTELTRYRKLAIDGFMQPTAEMQDVYNHPLYRVNKIIQRLSKIDYQAMIDPKQTMSPLTLMDPFEGGDDSGRTFTYFPGHANYKPNENSKGIILEDTPSKSKSLNKITKPSPRSSVLKGIPSGSQPVQPESSSMVMVAEESTPPTTTRDEDEGESQNEKELEEEPETIPLEAELETEDVENDEAIDEEGDEPSWVDQVKSLEDATSESLANLRKRYGIREGCDLKIWEPFHSHLLDVFDKMNVDTENAVGELYKVADEVVGVYNREVLEAEEACVQLGKVMNAVANNLEIPGKPIKSQTMTMGTAAAITSSEGEEVEAKADGQEEAQQGSSEGAAPAP